MKDTHLGIDEKFRKMITQLSGERRLIMACSMFDTARQLVRSSIYEKNPDITESRMRKEIFLRFYGEEFSETERKKILASLK